MDRGPPVHGRPIYDFRSMRADVLGLGSRGLEGVSERDSRRRRCSTSFNHLGFRGVEGTCIERVYPQWRRLPSLLGDDSGHARRVNLPGTFAYVEAFAAARSCLGALADLSDFDESCRYERLLIDLDGIHAGDFPATEPMYGTLAELLARLEAAIDRMVQLGGETLSLALFLADVIAPITDP